MLVLADTTRVESPPLEHLAFYVGLGGMVMLGLVELPIAVALTVGHVLIGLTHRPGSRSLGRSVRQKSDRAAFPFVAFRALR